MFEQYYEEELRYLYESGKLFAKAHPERAQFLNIDAVGDRDPYVERLFEGFAFLTARVREKLDDAFPELTEGLLDLMWPQFLQEIPSVAMLQLKPRSGHLQETRILPRNSEAISSPVGPEKAVCRFTTTQEVRLNPILIKSVDSEVDSRGNTTLSLSFELEQGVKWSQCKFDPVRLYIHGELPTAMTLHQFLTTKIISAQLVTDTNQTFDLEKHNVCKCGGLSPQESLLPTDPRSFGGYSLLLEYFIYPEKFLFVDLFGCDKVEANDPEPTTFTYKLLLEGEIPHSMPFGKDNFRLFCTPVVNLFKHTTVPVNRSGLKTEYRVVADAAFPYSIQAHSIISVAGIDKVTGERYEYEPLHTFKNIGNKKTRTYTVRYNRGFDDRRGILLQVGGEQLAGEEMHEESLTINAWCTNGDLAREEIREGGISTPGREWPDYLSLTNITRPTLACRPPEGEEYLWMFLSHLGSTYTTLGDAETLKSFLRLYNWSRGEGKGRRIDAVTESSAQPTQMVVQGSVIRGVRFTVGLQEAQFTDSGDLHLFGEILKEFLAQYVSINSFVELVFVLKPSGKTLSWNSIAGRRWQI